ncbi:porin family protein [Massilia sp. TWR1-2-2]|uniref:porin family protein n=1 Tax=Massilia sp. TWR1-2-2 TaxID=2804584 RepID=UPI003CF7E638
MLKKIAFAAALAILSTSSFAAENPSVYAGVDVGSTKLDGFSDRETSFGGFIGYQFHQNMAVELGYRSLADFDTVVSGTKVGVKLNQTAVSFIGTLPLSSGFNVFGRLGYNHLEAKGSVSGFSAADSTNGVLYGVGVGYAFNAKIAARVEVQKPSSDSSNVSIGVSYKF